MEFPKENNYNYESTFWKNRQFSEMSIPFGRAKPSKIPWRSLST